MNRLILAIYEDHQKSLQVKLGLLFLHRESLSPAASVFMFHWNRVL